MDTVSSIDTVLWIWLGVAVIFSIVEVLTMDLATIWFAIGSVFAMIFVSLGLGLYWQLGVFLVVSIVLIIFTRPIVVKKLKVGKTKTNADSLIGGVCVVSEDVDNILSLGRVTIKGQSWSARSTKDIVTFSVGERAVVKKIAGVKLIIEKIEK